MTKVNAILDRGILAAFLRLIDAGETDMKRILLSIGLIALATGAHAQLFHNGISFPIDTTNSPGTSSDEVIFTPGVAQSLDFGALDLIIQVVDAGGGKEWAVFNYLTDHQGNPLSSSGLNWSIEQIGIPTAVATNFIADFTQWLNPDGAVINQTGSIFGQTLGNTPVPGFTGNGEGNSGFVTPFPAGPLPQLGALADPFQLVINGLNGVTPSGFRQALEFEAQSPSGVPEPRTWAMMLIGFTGLGFAALKRRKQLPSIA
jgi:hypothetical protein